MMRPKKVAIIGAGPSGLVMAKTLLHNFPEGTFDPVIFEKSDRVGGLWGVDRPVKGDARFSLSTTAPSTTAATREKRAHRSRGLVDPSMRTNLSRFSVSFSDLAWESVVEEAWGEGVPIFPQAWQVGRYLERYAERYLSRYDVLRLGHRVVSTERVENAEGEGRWVVRWKTERGDTGENPDEETKSARFDFLVVASGHFGSPSIPRITGLKEFGDRMIHSSELQNRDNVEALIERSGATGGKLVVVGGSMSGVEAASALALHVSHLNLAQGGPEYAGKSFEVHHVCSRPFWALPLYLPHRYSQGSSMPFLPLDLVLYDLGRRGPGAVEFGFGPVAEEQVSKVNGYFLSLLGDDYGRIGSTGVTKAGTREKLRPSWVTIGDDYAEYIRSGVVKVTTGRVGAVHCEPESGPARIDIDTRGGGTTSLDDVAAVVMATGFMPNQSLSFLPKAVLDILEFSSDDHFLPLILDGKGISHAQVPDLGFVGFYRGAFWGPMEMQAQSLAETWANVDVRHEVSISSQRLEEKANERQLVRDFRNADSEIARGQFPMGDYVGLMESFARDLGISRGRIPELSGKPGPVVPARYTIGTRCLSGDNDNKQKEILRTMNALQQTMLPNPECPSVGAAAAVFRALHGEWNFRKEVRSKNDHSESVTISGKATFYPRYPSSPEYGKEYVYEEVEDGTESTKLVYGLLEDTSLPSNGAHILIWPTDTKYTTGSALTVLHQLRVMPAREHDDPGPSIGRLLIRAVDVHKLGSNGPDKGEFLFHLEGISISKWECIVRRDTSGLSKTVYER